MAAHAAGKSWLMFRKFRSPEARVARSMQFQLGVHRDRHRDTVL